MKNNLKEMIEKQFTSEQIHQAVSKTKSGKDFPQFVKDLKSIGVTRYENFVADGKTIYYGCGDFMLLDKAKYPTIEINHKSSAQKLKEALTEHQKGKTDYPTFCKEAAEAGVEKWTTNLLDMTVTYFDKMGNQLIAESISNP